MRMRGMYRIFYGWVCKSCGKINYGRKCKYCGAKK